MKSVNCRAFVLAGAAVVFAGGSTALAHPSHHHRHYARHHAQREPVAQSTVNPYYFGPGAAPRYAFTDGSAHEHTRGHRHEHAARVARRHARGLTAYASVGFGGGGLVADARRYIGTNPTGRRSLWCGAFMDKVLRDTGHRGGGNLATGYLHYGRRVSGPQVGAIAVMYRRGGGHVGVVSGIDENGNPIIISGNHNHTVAEATYPRHRIAAYVMPGG